MPRNTKRDYAALIVSNSEQFNMAIKKALPGGSFSVIETRKSASSAKRELLARSYDVIIVNAPLMDEFGVDFVMDIQDRVSSSILVAVPAEILDTAIDRLIDYGVLVVAKPLKKNSIEKNIRLMVAMQNRLKKNEKKIRTLEEKMAELRAVSRAKLMLIQRGMEEEDAEKYIIKQAMDRGVKKIIIANEIIDG